MSQARSLFRVQEIELAVIENRKRLNEIATLLENNESVQQAQQQYNSAQQTLDNVLQRVKEIELQIESVVTKHKTTESRLYSGNVKNPKELQDMQMEMESLTRRRADLDDQLLEVMVERDVANEYFQLADDELQQVMQTWEAEHAGLLDEKQQLTQASQDLMVKRKDALQRVDASALKEYNSLRNSKSNRPMAIMQDKTCNVCGIEQNGAIVSAVNRDDSLVKCQNCGRILVRL